MIETGHESISCATNIACHEISLTKGQLTLVLDSLEERHIALLVYYALQRYVKCRVVCLWVVAIIHS